MVFKLLGKATISKLLCDAVNKSSTLPRSQRAVLEAATHQGSDATIPNAFGVLLNQITEIETYQWRPPQSWRATEFLDIGRWSRQAEFWLLLSIIFKPLVLRRRCVVWTNRGLPREKPTGGFWKILANQWFEKPALSLGLFRLAFEKKDNSGKY